MHLKNLQKEQLKKKLIATVDLISNKIPNVLAKSYDGKIMAVSKNP